VAADSRQVSAEVRAFFDDQAASWDTAVCPQHAERLCGIIDELGIAPDSRVLDVGAGAGILLPILGGVLRPPGLVIALDISAKMLLEARKKSAPRRCLLIQGDAAAVPMPNAFFNWILCNSVFPHFIDPVRILKELSRILDPSGRLVSCHTQSRHAITALHRAVGGVVGNHNLPTARALEEILSAVGFRGIRAEDHPERFMLVARKST